MTRRVPRSLTTVGGDTRALAVSDPDKALKTITTLEAAEKHFKRAWRNSNDPFAREQLHAAIDAKIETQVGYIIFRDSVVVPSQKVGSTGRKGGNRITDLKADLPDADPGDVKAHRWRKKFFNLDADVWTPDEVKIATCKAETKRLAIKACEGDQPANYSSASVEWFTPPPYVEAAREVLGGIDLDPASSVQANVTVRAARIFTREDDGLAYDWHGRVFLNPPYGRDEGDSVAAAFCNKAISEYESSHIEACIILVNSVPDQKWQAPLYEHPFCLTDHRIKFISADGFENANPTYSNMFVYLGPNVRKFARVFRRFGYVLGKIDPEAAP